MKTLNQLLQTDRGDWACLILRLGLGGMILPHGLQKAFGLFGGFGFAESMQYFTIARGFPWLLGFAVIFSELVGGTALLLGLATRLSAFLIGVTMFVAGLTFFDNGFFMNWFGKAKGEGMEFFLLAVSIAAALLIRGGGRFSVDGEIRSAASKPSA